MGESSTAIIIEDSKFSMLEGKVNDKILKAIKNLGFEKPTPIQIKTLPHLLQGKDVIGAAKTGSGKTLAFLIPMLELLLKLNFNQKLGTGCIILSPTRELALQTFELLIKFLNNTNLNASMIVGGENRNKEVALLREGVNIIVATPGRLFDHLSNTPGFKCNNLKLLVLDEADKLLEAGFKKHIVGIIKNIPKNRQTVLFSATIDDNIKDLARLSMKESPMLVSLIKDEKVSTVSGLKQGYFICEFQDRIPFIFKMLKKTKNQKVMVFFSSCKVVDFYYMFFKNHCDASVISIHGKQSQGKRKLAYHSFVDAKSGILFCTDIAARGLDIPAVDWIIQFDPPSDTRQYIHRVGRTARGEATTGNAVIILRKAEIPFLKMLESEKVFLDKYDFEDLPNDAQNMLEELVENDGIMKTAARKAYFSYLRSYKSHNLKKIFNVKHLDLKAAGKPFGMPNPPHVDLKTV